MSKTTAKYRRPLNEKQLHLLKLIYKFRFVTIEGLSEVLNNEKSVIRKRLTNLVEQEYIGRNYDSSYRLQNKHASYYLLPNGINILKTQGLDETVLHSMYKDRSASQRFVEHSLEVMRIYTQLRKLYGAAFSIYTRSELAPHEQFPKPRPDLYLNGERDYILELLDTSTPFFAIRKIISRYIEHEENGEWEGGYPTLLFVCGSTLQETRVLKLLDHVSESTDLQFMVTTLKALSMSGVEEPIWTLPELPDQLIALMPVKTR